MSHIYAAYISNQTSLIVCGIIHAARSFIGKGLLLWLYQKHMELQKGGPERNILLLASLTKTNKVRVSRAWSLDYCGRGSVNPAPRAHRES